MSAVSGEEGRKEGRRKNGGEKNENALHTCGPFVSERSPSADGEKEEGRKKKRRGKAAAEGSHALGAFFRSRLSATVSRHPFVPSPAFFPSRRLPEKLDSCVDAECRGARTALGLTDRFLDSFGPLPLLPPRPSAALRRPDRPSSSSFLLHRSFALVDITRGFCALCFKRDIRHGGRREAVLSKSADTIARDTAAVTPEREIDAHFTLRRPEIFAVMRWLFITTNLRAALGIYWVSMGCRRATVSHDDL